MNHRLVLLLIIPVLLAGCQKDCKDPYLLLLEKDERIKARGAYIIIHEGYAGSDTDKIISLLIAGANSSHLGLQCNSILALGKLGDKSSDAVPELIKLLTNQHKEIRGNSALSLGRIKSNLDITIPALIDFSNRDHEVGWQGLMALGYIGNEAKDAIPYLKSRLEDHDETVRIYAKDAILKISPDEMKSFETTIKTTITVDGKTTIVPSGLKREKELQLISAIRTEDIEETSSLIAEGVNLDCVDDFGRPALLFAIEKSNAEMVKLLLQNGANPNVSYGERTALEMAVIKANSSIVDLLKYYQSNLQSPEGIK